MIYISGILKVIIENRERVETSIHSCWCLRFVSSVKKEIVTLINILLNRFCSRLALISCSALCCSKSHRFFIKMRLRQIIWLITLINWIVALESLFYSLRIEVVGWYTPRPLKIILILRKWCPCISSLVFIQFQYSISASLLKIEISGPIISLLCTNLIMMKS